MMENLVLAFAFTLISLFSSVESPQKSALEGAWEMKMPEEFKGRTVMTIQAPYVFITQFDVETKAFYGSSGGTIEIMGNKVFYKVEFNTNDSDQIGSHFEITTELKGNQLTTSFEVDGKEEVSEFTRIDAANSDLAGAWRITERMRNGEMTAMRQGVRKTIKMITGTRFQWVAFNPETKQFSGTGGGTAIVKDGKYIEQIEFFSRNAERVGAELSFDYEVNGDKWVHSGLSSSGNPIKEIWTRQ